MNKMEIIQISELKINEHSTFIKIKNFKEFNLFIKKLEKLSKIPQFIYQLDNNYYALTENLIFCCEDN